MTGVFVVSLVSWAVVAFVATVPMVVAMAIVGIVPAGVRRCGVQFVRLSHSGWKVVTQSD